MIRQYPGYFISFEGSEGCGKTTQLRHLAEVLKEEGISVYPTREPGGDSISEQIRGVLHDLKNTEMHPRTETLLYQAARAQFVEQIVRPKLQEGQVVITDRYADSTIAYQGYGRQQDREQVVSLIRYATGGLTPDLSIFFDVDIEVGLSRRRAQDWNRMDALPPEFYRRVREGYQDLVMANPVRWEVINANHGIDEVFHDLKRVVERRLTTNGFLERPSLGHER